MEVSDELHAPTNFPTEKEPGYPFDRLAPASLWTLWKRRNLSIMPGIESRVFGYQAPRLDRRHSKMSAIHGNTDVNNFPKNIIPNVFSGSRTIHVKGYF
jgi:hypothetical protein